MSNVSLRAGRVVACLAVVLVFLASFSLKGSGAIVIHKDVVSCSVNADTTPPSFYQGDAHEVITPTGDSLFECRAELVFGPGVSPAARRTDGDCEIFLTKTNAIMTCRN